MTQNTCLFLDTFLIRSLPEHTLILLPSLLEAPDHVRPVKNKSRNRVVADCAGVRGSSVLLVSVVRSCFLYTQPADCEKVFK